MILIIFLQGIFHTLIYIHIPFCRQICSYCDFHHSASLARKDEMIAIMLDELNSRSNFVATSETLYFGGGTPSVCSSDEIGKFINRVKQLWNISHFSEVTLEANPEDLSSEYLDSLLSIGIDRLSIGIQSFVDEHLVRMNRRHNSATAIDAVRRAKNAGFGNITIDLMYGLPWMSDTEWESNIAAALSLGVQHISAYHLTIEPRTILGKRHETPVDEQVSEFQFDILHKKLTYAGYEHYEVSNFALPGFRAVHNSGYWQGKPYLGIGPSAHSFDGLNRRHWNVSSNKLYLEGNKGEEEILSEQDIHNEFMMTRLRTSDGFSIHEYESRFSRSLRPIDGLIIDQGRARISPEDFLVSDSIISNLFII